MSLHRWLFLSALALGLSPAALAQDPPRQAEPVQLNIEARVEAVEPEAPPMQDVPYLGLAVVPTRAEAQTQLKLGEGVGLTVMDVAEGSPAAKAGVQRLDVIHRLDDQILVNQQQLGTLVRLRGAGQAVTLHVYRAGEAKDIALEIGTTPRRVPAAPRVRFAPGAIPAELRDPPAGDGDAERAWVGHDPEAEAADERMNQQMQRIRRELQNNEAIQDEQRQRVMDLMEQMRQHRAQALGQGGGNIAHAMRINDGEHAIDIRTTDGDKQLKVTDQRGEVIFEGPINTDEQRAAVPADVMAKIEKFEKRARVEIRLDGMAPINPAPRQAPAPTQPEPHTLN